jgi:putative ABC transport system permease protein
LSEAAVAESGIKDPIGKRFTVWQTSTTIIGVVNILDTLR